ncbi:MAG: 1-(5-phosphoribosyl)-5-[(5-phosphoribosylamino)methylideneamino]imidazole-4-carboxamide isomerase [Spirochaetota bacterium]
MRIIPAIDIKNGKCVRLVQGDPDRETVYCDDPVVQAKIFADAGAKLIHVVDLDGAFAGLPVNCEIVKRIACEISVPIEIGGGIRTTDIMDEYSAAGIKRFIVGTAALENFDLFRDMVSRFGDSIIAGVDAKSAKVATRGWKNVSGVGAVEFIAALLDEGVKEVIYTDIATDGMLTGPNYAGIEEILDAVPGIRLIASGGIGSIDDIRRLKTLESKGVSGCIMGKAVYDGRIILTEALSLE